MYAHYSNILRSFIFSFWVGNRSDHDFDKSDIITSAREVVLYPAFVCLFAASCKNYRSALKFYQRYICGQGRTAPVLEVIRLHIRI